jgi:hypothetical protein
VHAEFLRRFLSHAAASQPLLHDFLSDPKVKGSHPIHWTPDLHRTSKECKGSLSRAILLAHPDPSAPLVTDVSTSALQQRVNVWQSIAFFSRKLSLAQQKYSEYDRELLVICEAVKYFPHMLEALLFIVFTDDKPFPYVFQQKRGK